MSAPLSKSLRLSSALNITEEAMVTKKQGIVSILGSDTDRPSRAASLRRTLSADMSSKKWLTEYGLSPLKKIASSEEFPFSIIDSSSEGGEEDYEERKDTEARGQFDIWTSIQQEKNKKELEKPGQFDMWTSIISEKAQEDSSKPLTPPYIHPLVKRSASSLSEKSLEICTESLGSETGSDGFSSYPPSETGDMEEDKEEDQELQQQKQERVAQLNSFDGEEPRIVKYNYDVGKKSPHRSFPPPIPSLSRIDGASVRMKTHRDNGRLVLEAVSMPSLNNFLAQRQDGRLVLTFANTTPSEAESMVNEVMNVEEEEEKEVEDLEEEFESFGEEEQESEIDEEEEEEISENEIEGVEDRCYVIEQPPKLSSGAMNVHRLAVMMNKPIWLANRNPTWPKNFDEIVKFGEEREEKVVEPTAPPLAQSLPPRPRVGRLIPSPPSTAAAASFNAYEYYWRPNQPMSKAAVLNPLGQQSTFALDDNSNKELILSKNLMANEQQQLLVLRGNKAMGESNASVDEDLLLKAFFAEVSEVERDNEVIRILSCFKLNPFEFLNLAFDSSPEDVKKQYRKLSLMVHPDKCKHPQAKEAFGALAKAQQHLLDQQERDYILSQVTAAKEELRAKRKKQLKKDTASKLKLLVDEGKSEQQYEQSEEFQQELKLKVRELLTEQEWRRRKMAMRISEEEGRLKKDEEEQKEMWKRKREHEEQWEGTREQRVSSWRDFMKSGKKSKKGELRPPKLKTEDPNKSYVQRPVKRG
ncbi:Chaperone DnaJ-domain superfamily protein [Theobroma cacao]|uniref:Chaperone DnaJ-domain superfamily protein n=2 Tax=Theobroma cacao TaxID=3641 RepID=A0A061GTX3_THECC|nr:Chaperone DnaJ-domain superfamily protein [Theobroma cacao]